MTDTMLLFCLGLTVAAGALKYRIRFNLGRFRRDIATLKGLRVKAVAQRRQAEDELAYAELRERELTNDCRELSGGLKEVLGRLRELDELSETRAKRRGQSSEETNEPGEGCSESAGA